MVFATVNTACEEYDYELDEHVKEIFTKYRRTHNNAVFRVYTKTMRLMRKTGILTQTCQMPMGEVE